MARLRTRALSENIGVEVNGVDLTAAAAISTRVVAMLHELLAKHSVLLFRGCPLTDEQHISFAAKLGQINPPLPSDPAAARSLLPLSTLSNIDANGELIDPADTRVRYLQGNSLWHSDGSFRAGAPTPTSLLSATVIPPQDSIGGETEFASTLAAYRELPDARKQQLEGLVAMHSIGHSRRQLNVAGGDSQCDPDAGVKERSFVDMPAVPHTLVRTIPDVRGGAKALHIGAYAEYVIGMPREEGEALLAELLDWATQPRFTYAHRWRAGDMLIYDNRGSLHRATPWDITRYKRVLRRVTLKTAAGRTDAVKAACL
eukprot:SAG11_NODE_4835_length_1750_cov_1.293761_2_plen_315_part_00